MHRQAGPAPEKHDRHGPSLRDLSRSVPAKLASLVVPRLAGFAATARPSTHTRTALVIDSSLTVWSSRIGGNIPRKSKDFAKSNGGVGLSEPSSEYNPILIIRPLDYPWDCLH